MNLIRVAYVVSDIPADFVKRFQHFKPDVVIGPEWVRPLTVGCIFAPETISKEVIAMVVRNARTACGDDLQIDEIRI